MNISMRLNRRKKVAKINWTEITRKDVLQAIENFLNENPEYPEPRSTFLLYEHKRLPAKHIRWMAYQEHYGVQISKSDFGGGLETVRFFERLGFEVDYHGESKKTILVKRNKKVVEQPIECGEIEEISEKKKTTTIKKNNADKIVIPSKKVIEQKNALQLILNRLFDGEIVCEKTYPWLKTPEQIEGAYEKVYNALYAYRGNTTFAKKNVALRCDFVCESRKLIVEYDERQHFSEARRISLESYEDVGVLYDRSLWIKACEDIKAKDNNPINRDEIRAYYDSVRDIACYENGYTLVRIMHGQIDFEAATAKDKLQNLLKKALDDNTQKKNEVIESKPFIKQIEMEKAPSIKVAMYLQTDELKNKKEFAKILPIMKKADVDIIVFPEYCYVPFYQEIVNTDITLREDLDRIFAACLNFSRELGKSVIVSSHDKYDTIYSVYANANPVEGDTDVSLYIKHTMCGSSCLEFDIYQDIAPELFDPILLKGYLIGMTICYDCNHGLFSRLYGLYGIDLIINSTGGDVVYDKWFKYNKARAIENNCYTLVTMGGDGLIENGHNYVFGFNKNGGQLKPVNLCGDSSIHNMPGGLYVYDVRSDEGIAEYDNSNQFETENKNWNLKFLVGHSSAVLSDAKKLSDNIWHKKLGVQNVFFLMVDGMDILKPEKVQRLLYAAELKKYSNRKYVIVNRHDIVDEKFFKEKLSLILKVRSMENFCAVVLESNNINKCYQCGKNRTAQVVKATEGFWGIDLERTSGPEAIWKNKVGMKASWRKNYEWLVENAEKLYDEV